MELAIALLTFALIVSGSHLGQKVHDLKKTNASLELQLQSKCPPPTAPMCLPIIKRSVDRDYLILHLYGDPK